MLEFDKVGKTYSSSKFNIKDISFTLGEREIVGLIGRNCTGKSTILKMANQLVTKDSEKIKALKEAITSDVVKDFINTKLEGHAKPAF